MLTVIDMLGGVRTWCTCVCVCQVVLNAMDWHEVWLTQCTTVAACSALGLEAIVRHLVTEAGCSATEEGNPVMCSHPWLL